MGIILLISSGLTLFHYVLLKDGVLSLMTFVISVVLYSLTYSHLQQQTKRQKRFHQTYFFILNFIMNLSLKGSIQEAYEDTKRQLPASLEKTMQAYETNQTMITLTQLHRYFTFSIYQVTLQMIRFYEEKGGHVLMLFDRLLKQLRLEETRRLEKQAAIERALIQFIVLWVLNLAILAVAYFVLSNLFLAMASGLAFRYFLTGFFLYISLSSYLWVRQYVHDA